MFSEEDNENHPAGQRNKHLARSGRRKKRKLKFGKGQKRQSAVENVSRPWISRKRSETLLFSFHFHFAKRWNSRFPRSPQTLLFPLQNRFSGNFQKIDFGVQIITFAATWGKRLPPYAFHKFQENRLKRYPGNVLGDLGQRDLHQFKTDFRNSMTLQRNVTLVTFRAIWELPLK